MAASEHLFFCAVLHDVAPQTWHYYRTAIEAIDALGLPLTLLVVPDFHGQGPIDRFPAFCRAIDTRLARGDEVVLHGYYHHDDVPLRLSPTDWIRRRVLTHEAEFHALPAAIARSRLERGMALFSALDWPVRGFVAPGWMLGPDTVWQLRQLGFRYTSTFDALLDLETGRELCAPVLVWSPGSAGRRGLSLYWNRHRLRHFAGTACLRLGLHPSDMGHGLPRRFWMDTVSRLAAERCAVTKLGWLEGHSGPRVG